MEVKEIAVADLQTLGSLSEAIEYYRNLQDELSRLELSKKIAREAILEKFQDTGMRVFDTASGLRARADTRTGREYIDVVEAKAMLDWDTLGKLLRTATTTVTLSVRQIKEQE